MKKHKLLIFLSLCLLLILALFAALSHAYPLEKPVVVAVPTVAPTQPAYRQDPQVAAIMQRLGLDYGRLNLIYAINPHSSHDASFTTPNSLYITPNVQPQNMDVMVSHEYLHYIQTLPSSHVIAIDPDIETVLARDAYLQGRVTPYYGCRSACFSIDDEAIAYGCTEMPDYALTPKLVDWCNKYLPQRYSLF